MTDDTAEDTTSQVDDVAETSNGDTKADRGVPELRFAAESSPFAAG